MILSTVIKKVKSVLKEHKITPFLIAESVKELTAGSKTLMLGVKWEEFEGKAELMVNDFGIEFEGHDIDSILLPYSYIRGFKIRIDNVLVVIVAYFEMNEIRYCPFTKGHVNLSFPNELLNNMKSKRIGNQYLKIPTPVEDYLNCTFDKNGRYLVEPLVNE